MNAETGDECFAFPFHSILTCILCWKSVPSFVVPTQVYYFVEVCFEVLNLVLEFKYSKFWNSNISLVQ